MKKWRVQVKGITTVEVEADNYDDAISKVKAKTIIDLEKLKWENFDINPKSIEVINEEN